jgi:hypothetical protein
LTLEMTDAFRGMVLAAAAQQTDSREAAFELLGQEMLVKNRNHHRAMRREVARVRDLVRLLGGALDQELEAALATDEDD